MWTYLSLSLFLIVVIVTLVSGTSVNKSLQPERNRIVNGTDTSIEYYPFMVSIRFSSNYHACGGTIIAPNWILTAAHCIQSLDSALYSVQYGVSAISITGPTIIDVVQIIYHPDFSTINQYFNDIALFRLATPITFNEKIYPVRLSNQGLVTPSGVAARLLGWGLNQVKQIHLNLMILYVHILLLMIDRWLRF